MWVADRAGKLGSGTAAASMNARLAASYAVRTSVSAAGTVFDVDTDSEVDESRGNVTVVVLVGPADGWSALQAANIVSATRHAMPRGGVPRPQCLRR